MQYQLEHHLFPTMPRYKYTRVVPIVKKFAADHGLEYKADSLVRMISEHVATLKKNAAVAAIEN